jgi:hypothetical protein
MRVTNRQATTKQKGEIARVPRPLDAVIHSLLLAAPPAN